MDYYKFEWDESKSESNLRKHGIPFEEAVSVFSDNLSRLIPDPDSSYGEERFIILGESSKSRLLVVCHCYRDSLGVIRLISARRADKREQKKYKEFRHA